MKKSIIHFFTGKGMAMLLTLALVLSSFGALQMIASAETVGIITNGGFEDGLHGYQTTASVKTEVITDIVHGGSKAIKLGATEEAWSDAFLYQEVNVKPNTEYKWTFWFLTESSNNTLVGVRTADGTNLLPSEMETSTGDILDVTKKFENLREVADANWHKGMARYDGKWHQYTVSFNSGDQTAVLLTINMFYQSRKGYTDDWFIIEDSGVGSVLNGGFEDGLYGYQASDSLAATVISDIVHDGCKAIKIDATENAWNNAFFFQEVAVKENTDYVWTFWFLTESSNNTLVGVRTADGTNLLPSEMETSTGDILDVTKKFENLRGVAAANWHKGMARYDGKWHQYTVSFNSGDQTKVLLTLNLFADGRVGYTDDWSIREEIKPVKLTNGGFEDDLNGYQSSDHIIAQVATDIIHSGSKAVKLESTSEAWNTALFFQEVAVRPETDYVWTFWHLTQKSNNTLVGVRTADGTQLLPSEINSSTGNLSETLKKQDVLRPTSVGNNWHQGLTLQDGKWHKYTVKFNSGDQTKVLLTLNLFANERVGYTDDWSICENIPVCGDANGDRVIDAIDLVVIRSTLLKGDVIYNKNLDANDDNKIDIIDLVHLKKILVESSVMNGYTLVWADEFEGTTLNDDKWNLYPHMREQEDLELRYEESAVKVNDGKVTLSTGRVDQNKYYANASLTTSETMAFKYGYVEMRAKIPFGGPAAPCLWMKSAQIENPNVMGEIDIIEQFPDRADGSAITSAILLWYGQQSISKEVAWKIFDNQEQGEEWHNYGFLWTPEKFEFFVDGVSYGVVNLNDEHKGLRSENGEFIEENVTMNMEDFDDYYYLIMNNYLYTENGMSKEGYNANENTEFPIDFEIDYVRLYQRVGEGDIISLK